MSKEIGSEQFLEYLNLIGKGLDGLKEWEEQQKTIICTQNGLSCVVLNANPFTTGQRYLVELAAKRSAGVIAFVIQGRPESGGKGNHENTGIEFPFTDRFDMAKTALSDLKNVTVLPSGPYLISRSDFPKGFLSEDFGAAPAHAVLDSMAFCHVCNSLGIRSAFAGDEPRDELSEIHLNALRIQCRENSIALKVAERKRIGERYISSALARQALADNKKDELKELVPESILEYLLTLSSRTVPCF